MKAQTLGTFSKRLAPPGGHAQRELGCLVLFVRQCRTWQILDQGHNIINMYLYPRPSSIYSFTTTTCNIPKYFYFFKDTYTNYRSSLMLKLKAVWVFVHKSTVIKLGDYTVQHFQVKLI